MRKKSKKELQLAAKALMICYPIEEADCYILQRFCFEPRYDSFYGRTWLVIWDRLYKSFVPEKKGSRKYYKCNNSDEGIQFLRSKYIKKPGEGLVEEEG